MQREEEEERVERTGLSKNMSSVFSLVRQKDYTETWWKGGPRKKPSHVGVHTKHRVDTQLLLTFLRSKS